MMRVSFTFLKEEEKEMEDKTIAAETAAGETPSGTTDMTCEDVERLVRRGRQLRAAALAAVGKRFFENWASLFRRPGRVIPAKEKAI